MSHRRTGVKIERRPKTFYFVDGLGLVWGKPAGKGGKKHLTGKSVDRKPKHMYFVDKGGNVCEAPMKRRSGKKR